MAEDEGETGVQKALENCVVLQSMIDISAENLQGLRTQCATSAELTQQEIRTLEGKLVKYFSRQLVAKARLLDNDKSGELKKYPRLQQWLVVVGLCKNSIQFVCERVATLEDLLEMPDIDIRQRLLPTNGGKCEEERRLINAIQNLRLCTECLRCGDKGKCDKLDLHWDSWDHTTSGGLEGGGGPSPRAPRLHSTRPSVASDEPPPAIGQQQQQHHHHQYHYQQRQPIPSSPPVPSSVASPWSPPAGVVSGGGGTPLFGGHHVVAPGANHHHHHHRDRRYTPPPTPPTTSKKGEKMRFPTTPPPRKRHQTAITSLLPDSYPLTKSKSHESQLANRIDPSDPTARADHPRRQRLLTEPGLESEQDDLTTSISTGGGSSIGLSSSLTNSPMRVSPHSCCPEQPNTLDDGCHAPYGVPASPRTPTLPPGLIHATHRFTKFVKIKATTCEFCRRQMFLGVKCKVCKYRCHRDCYEKLPPMPCVPPDHSALTKIANDGSHSPLLNRQPIHKRDNYHLRFQVQPQINAPFSNMDTCSTTSSSSCNSSTPSSPAPTYIIQTPPLAQAPARHFDFGALLMPGDIPDREMILETRTLPDSSEMCEMQKSNDSDKTMSGTSGSTDSEKTLAGRVDSQDSQFSDADSVDRAWPRQNSLSFREWEIPYVELVFGQPVGTGRFGIVYRGNWHGEVAIKVFNMDHMDDENTLDAFKQEVAMFRKTRHENLVLFMGACMRPPHLAIVTRLCKGLTLYTHVHIRRDRFNLNRAIIIAQQISQGMGYLHARGIVHKDLKTKNIFLENGKVVITDFGLFSVTKLCRGNRKGDWLTIPPGWLCYLAPEIVCRLRASNDFHDNDNIPFTKASDIYAFGTVWYELLCGEWPFKGQPPEAIIWQVGKGMKQSLANLQTSRDVKDILMICWSCQPQDRREFSLVLKLLEKLPKKRLARSPSHPIHLSRSAESVF